MEHPPLFEPDDPLVARLRLLCLALPEATEVHAWGRPTFRAGSKKIFAVAGAGLERPHAVIFKPDSEERRALIEDARFFSPPYFGPGGWLAIDVGARTDWVELRELLETSYRQVALKRQIALLDAHTP
ncbi:MmcQ/YjbR family DNA-binding protein [Microbacterium sp. STN6]|uniref:MmcQ/YjbR family DNA-binding protein n=1 Tax=Microbacterium sp. STN6 TaxID=2995588 RepID=UPI002260B669|nr:MmcQ/YjbR family DNA-binding protein [Microbacterium sp. STN6]MCX7522459.1 MmcQ/YjbR family DNA-binding protein [Microbacterium sp. STN6]